MKLRGLPRITVYIMALLLLFALRLGYGLCSEFWFPDELQVYLIGLKFYTTGHFPYFGPDVVYTSSQIPGALLGLLVGLPFYLLKIPEAPYIFLNLLSMSVLCFFAVYIQKRFTETPAWFIWIWLLTCPWAMNFSTHVLNPSYVLFGAVLFFIGFFEAIPKLSIGFLKPWLAFFLMGFALFWVYQLHMSWILLLPFIVAAFWFSFRKNKIGALTFVLGCLFSASTLIPTFLAYGLHAGSGNTSDNIVFNISNAKEILTVLLRYLSFASNEIPRFIDTDGGSKVQFFRDYLPAAPFMLFAILMGFLQVAYLIIAFFRKNPKSEFAWVKWITFIAMIITYLSFFFSVKGPSSHTFYVLFPLVMFYSFYCWQPLFRKKWFTVLMAVMLFSTVVTNGTLAYHNFHLKSMYKNRELPLKAIQEKDYHILGERRASDKNP
ncbi:MAG TPA: hypothetical protein PKI01_03705 [Bacteroidales bacterium]|nr:hypothetical protein [Bacteroidales bacterium]